MANFREAFIKDKIKFRENNDNHLAFDKNGLYN